MSIALRRALGPSYVWLVVGVVFLALLASAGLRAAPGVMMLPLEGAFGWNRATLSAAAALGIFLYGLVGPFAAALMQTLGIRRTLIGALALMAASTFASLWMSRPWEYVLSWGVLSGVGSGAVAMVLGATIANRWFTAKRGLAMGLLTASGATGSLVFLPIMAALGEAGGWRWIVMAVAGLLAALIPLVAWLVPEAPADIGLLPYGAAAPPPAAPAGRARDSIALAFAALGRAARTRAFWLLFGTFFVCGLTTNGLIGTHLIAYCGDNGLGAVRAAGLLAMMGLFDLVGTTASGWLTDRVDPRKLLFVYYAVRGLSLLALPYSGFDYWSLSAFAVFYGLDWIATVPPTVRLATDAFGERDAGIVFGWIAAGHQLGAASAALGAGLIRQTSGSYLGAFLIAGAVGVAAGFASLAIRRAAPAPALA